MGIWNCSIGLEHGGWHVDLDQIMKETELKKKAEARRAVSDDILENVFSTLMTNLERKKKEQ